MSFGSFLQYDFTNALVLHSFLDNPSVYLIFLPSYPE